VRAVTSRALAAFAVMGLTVAWAAPFTTAQAPPAPGEPFTVMSFNIRYGTANDGEHHWLTRRQQLFDLLRAQRADIIGVQEALRDQLDEILAAVPGYAFVGVGRADGRQAGEYAAVLYRTDRFQVRRSETFWLSDTPGVVKSASWGNRIERICTWAYVEDARGPSFFVYNVHLDHQSQSSRERSVALLLATIAARDPRAPVIVTGDFNAGEQNPATTAMRAAFRDTFRLRFPDARDVGTFNGFKPDQTTGDKIDYVFAEPGTEVLDAAIVRTAQGGRSPSDHFPVTARVRLR
jgi:endonuclease/exonuclease/phosphatase family metal-dependent hydrolase